MLYSLDTRTTEIYPGYINVSMKMLERKFPTAAFTRTVFLEIPFSLLTSAPGLTPLHHSDA